MDKLHCSWVYHKVYRAEAAVINMLFGGILPFNILGKSVPNQSGFNELTLARTTIMENPVR